MIPLGEVPQTHLIFSLSIKNKILKFGAKSRTYAEIGVSTGQPTSKNHNYFYTERNEVIQIL